jgi:hypothetical protein
VSIASVGALYSSVASVRFLCPSPRVFPYIYLLRHGLPGRDSISQRVLAMSKLAPIVSRMEALNPPTGMQRVGWHIPGVLLLIL